MLGHDHRRCRVQAWLRAAVPALASRLGLVHANGYSSAGYQAEEPQAGRIRAAQIAAIVRLTPVAMAASCLNAIILMLTLWGAGSFHSRLIVWAVMLLGAVIQYSRVWLARGLRNPDATASPRAIRRTIVNGTIFGALWAAVPVMIFPGEPTSIQLVVGCLSAGMMCAGGFVLGTVPLAGLSYLGMILLGSYYALLADGLSNIHLGLTALLTVYAAVVAVNIVWNAQLFVEHFLSEARLKEEVVARERAQAQVAHAQRMTALGELAGGIAHDFNNILQSVSLNAGLIANRAADREQVARLSGAIVAAAERGGAISRRMLAFARQDKLVSEPVDVADLFRSLPELIKHVIVEECELRTEIPSALPPLLADRAQLETILVNLAHNAHHAMPNGGILTLRATFELLRRDQENPALRAGEYIKLVVADTGTGMDPAVLARAMEPFFTTKPKNKGTGLGLSMAKGFAEQSGGALAISSRPGEGTSVALWLPKSPVPALGSQARPKHPGQIPGPPLPRHVLVVDDDSDIRSTLTVALEDTGFIVSGACDATAALAEIERAAAIDALVTDFSMPGMNGMELIVAARGRRPGLPAILLTGHVTDIVASDASQMNNERIVIMQKPVRVAKLIAQLSILASDRA